jgi:S1-C subfamily serine protease
VSLTHRGRRARPGAYADQGRASVVLLWLVVLALVVLLWPDLVARLSPEPPRPPAAPRVVEARGDLAEDERVAIEIFDRLAPSVVFITTLNQVRDFWRRNAYEVERGSGSGFLWDETGHVVTNFHVIAGADRVRVALGDGRTLDARVIGASPEHDLAVLRLADPRNLPPPLPLGESATLKVGQKVYAIGNPFGLDRTLTTGIISALDRSISGPDGPTINNLIQTDAAINPGNSGGPLIDSAGRLIGINTAIYSPSGASAGIGFAVPSDIVNRVVPQLIRDGRIVRPTLGIETDDRFSREAERRLGVRGLLVLGVTRGSGAAAAGLRPTGIDAFGNLVYGDIIEAVDGKPVRSRLDLLDALEGRAPGEVVVLTVWRDGERIPVEVVLSPPR